MSEQRPTDPILVQRARISLWTRRAQRVGYLLFAAATVAVVAAAVTGFPEWLLRVATWTLVVGCVVLGPAIIVAYTVKAADRDDRERGLG